MKPAILAALLCTQMGAGHALAGEADTSQTNPIWTPEGAAPAAFRPEWDRSAGERLEARARAALPAFVTDDLCLELVGESGAFRSSERMSLRIEPDDERQLVFVWRW